MQIGRKVYVVVALAVAAAAVVAVQSRSSIPEDVITGPIASRVPDAALAAGGLIDRLPATGAGLPSAAGIARPGDAPAVADPLASLPPLRDPTKARGRVSRLYVRAAEGVLLDWGVANDEQRKGWRYAALDFAAPLASGASRAMALIPESSGPVAVGDVVEMHFANRAGRGMRGISFFSGIEHDQITQLVARADTAIARSFEQRIIAAAGIDPSTGDAPDPKLWKSLPFERAIRIVRGNGKRELAVFSDPNCPACRAFEQTLAQLDNVTIHVFLLPVIRPDLKAQSKRIWCAPDRAKAWLELTLEGREPPAAECDDPVEANMGLLRTLDIRATPTIVFPDGQRTQGSLQAAALRQRLERAEGQASAAVEGKGSGA